MKNHKDELRRGHIGGVAHHPARDFPMTEKERKHFENLLSEINKAIADGKLQLSATLMLRRKNQKK